MFGRSLVSAALLLTLAAGSPLVAQDGTSKPVAATTGTPPAPSQATPSKPLETEPVPPPSKVVPREPRVLFITEVNNEKCLTELTRLRRPGGDFEAMKSRGWKIGPGPENHLQIVDRETISELVRELNVREFPTVACIEKGEIVRSFKDGCSTPLDAWTFGFLISGKNERPAASVPEAVRVASTGSYRIRGNHWSVDGDWNPARATVVSHLRGPNHAYRISGNWRLENWSYEELRSLHDDLHESEQGSSSSSSSSSRSSNTNRSPKDFSSRARP